MAGLSLAYAFRPTGVSALLISISGVLDDQCRKRTVNDISFCRDFPGPLGILPCCEGWHGFAEQEMATSVSHPSFAELSMTLALLLALLGSLVAMGVIVKRLEQNG